MRRFLVSVILLSIVCASAHSQDKASATETSRDPTPGACRAGNGIVVANLCAGQTLGNKINAADAALGNNPGEIWVHGGGAFGDEGSRVTISSNHTLRIFPGTYTSTGYWGVIILNNDSALICENPGNTILEEPRHATLAGADMWAIVQASGVFLTSPGSLTPYPNKNISVKGCRFKGTRSSSSGNFGSVAMANCHNCEVSGNIFEDLHAIGVYYGYPSNVGRDSLGLGLYSSNSSIRNNQFIHHNGIAMALTNGEDVSIAGNRCVRAGAGLSLCVDIEPNVATDRIVGVTITNNFIDLQGADALGDGMSISNNAGVPALRYRGILVENNKIDGAAASNTDQASKLLRNGIRTTHGAMDVHVRTNTIRFALGSAIYNNATRIFIQGNSIFGSNDYPIHLDSASSESVVSGNRLYCNTALTDVCLLKVQNDGAASNVISDNLSIGRPAIAAGEGAGTGSKVSIIGDDVSGSIIVTTGKTPSASATVVTLTYVGSYGSAPRAIELTPANANAAALSGSRQVYVDLDKANGASFVVKVGRTGLAAGTEYRWFYGPVKQ